MPSTGQEGAVDVSGGWYDAGDYGKYVVNAGISVGTLLLAQQLFPDAVADGDCRIPESGNGRSDLIDEIEWELNWLMRMQYPEDGGVFFKVGSLLWDGFVAPEDTKYERVVMGKSTTSALNFAAVMGKTAVSKIPANATLRNKYLKAAELAWKWALKHPTVDHPTEESGTGPYDDWNFEDEFLWAATSLAIATNKVEYWEQVDTLLAKLPANLAPAWQDVRNLAYLDLALSEKPVPDNIRKAACKAVLNVAMEHLKSIDRIPYRIPSEDFFWGSTSDQLNRAMMMAAAHHMTREPKWIDAVVETTDYIFGKNAVARSFVTGFGTRPPRYLHHRLLIGYGYENPFPGFLVGGPNPDIEDDVRKDPTGVLYPDVPPARQYMDHRDAAANNEICINWNAPLTFILCFLETHANYRTVKDRK